MDSIASSLLETLTVESSDPQNLTLDFSSYLRPLSDIKNKSSKKKNQHQSSLSTLRPLAKKFLPLLSGALKLIPGLLRQHSSSLPISGERVVAILKIYRLVIDCMDTISPCLAGNPNFVLLERGSLVCCLETWGKYEEAREEGVSVLKELGIEVRERVAGDFGSDREPEIVGLVAKLVCCLIGCAYKRKSKDGVDYEQILALVELVAPRIRVLDNKSTGKYHTLLVNTIYRCSLFLAVECVSFDSDLLTRFCRMTLLECLQSSMMDQFANISCSICKSFDRKWAWKPFLVLDLLDVTLKSILCGCQTGVLKVVNEILEFLSYCAESFSAASKDVCTHAVKLLYEQGDSFLQVSPPVASILFLYATGLYFKYINTQAKHDITVLSLNQAPEKLQSLSDSVNVLVRYFPISSHGNGVISEHEVKKTKNMLIVDLESCKNESCKQLHGNPSLLSYLDAVEFLCELLVEYVNMTWKCSTSEDKALGLSTKINHIHDALHQISDFILVAIRCRTTSERDKERLHQSHITLLQVAVSAFKISLRIFENHQKSLFLLDCVISSEWIEAQELKFLITEVGNVGVSLYNVRQLKQASMALRLRCKAIWTHVKLLCKSCLDKANGSHCGDISEDVLKSVTEAFGKCAIIVDTLHKCGSADFQDNSFLKGSVYEVAVKSLVELSTADDIFPDSTGSLALVKQWVKMLCRDFKDADAVTNAPVLYSFLKSYCSTWSNMTLGKILEQELFAYEAMEARNPDLCQKMQLKVVDILLDDVFTLREYDLQRSRILVRKGRLLRASGMKGLSGCLKCLRDAIYLLNDSGDPSPRSVLVSNQLAIAHLLAAQCTQEALQYAQEANQDHEVILQHAHKALEIWLNTGIQGHCSANDQPELSAKYAIPLLCSIVDLLSIKGCLNLQIDLCKLMIMFFKHEKVPVDVCLTILWSERRINHSLCSSPIDKDLILYVSQYLDTQANSFAFWVNCLKGDSSCQLAFLQKFLLCNSMLPEISLYNPEKSYGKEATIDEVKKTASSLISQVPLSSQSASIAGYLYYDLAERLFSNGNVFQALSHARMALLLRRNILRRNFICSFEQQSADPVDFGKLSSNRHEYVCLEAIGSVVTEVWPDSSKFSNLKNSILTPWSVLRCYLESILQVGIINESCGNGAEAEVLFLTGKRISDFQGFLFFRIVFATLLGQSYRKKQLYDSAENELKNARTILVDNEMMISCKNCKLALEVSIDMQFGDLYRYSFEKGFKIQSAKSSYQSALQKLNQDQLENSLSICMKLDTVDTLFSKHDMQESKLGVQNTSKLRSKRQAVKSAVCNICTSCSLNDDRKPRTRSRSRTSYNKTSNIASGENAGFDKSRKCWRCFLLEVMEDGRMQNILYLKWECCRRRLLLRLLMKLVKCEHGEHEVHDAFWHCISVIFDLEPSSQRKMNAHGSSLIKFIGEERSGDIFPVEWATVLYNLSWFVLNICQSEHSRKKCCSFASFQLPDVVPWLLNAFIVCREIPVVFQKVSKLLTSILLISTINPTPIPFFSKSALSINHWAAYFHQASIGSYLLCQYLGCVKDNTFNLRASEDSSSSCILDAVIKTSNFLRLAPERLEQLEAFVGGFFQSLPNVPIICMSLIGGDHCTLLGENVLPTAFPVWMLLSRLQESCQPIVMLLPLDAIPQDSELEGSIITSPGFADANNELKDWQCPWGYTSLDCVVPSFKLILKENFLSSYMTHASADSYTKKMNWWSQRTRLDKCLNKLLESMEDSWLGPWGCLLLGDHSDPVCMSKIVPKLLKELKLHFKCEANENLVKAVLGGSKSVADAESCIYQLLLYKGHYGRGACCDEERLGAFSSACHKGTINMPEPIHSLIVEALGDLADPFVREPVIFVLDSDVQMLCWESLPVLRSQEIYRMPSVGSIILTLKRCSHHHKSLGVEFPTIDPSDAYFLLNPSGDLDNTQVEFEQWFRNHKWEGQAGKIPTSEELVLALHEHDLFLYFGHGSGMQYISGKEISKLDHCAATLLMGCSSGSLTYKGCYAPRGAPLSYLLAGSPAVIANLWDVTDKDIDRFGKVMVRSWLEEESSVPLENCSRCSQLAQEFGCLEIGDTRSTTQSKTKSKSSINNNKLQESCNRGGCEVCGRKRIASFMCEARDACKLPYLIGASPVCYGVPTFISRNRLLDST